MKGNSKALLKFMEGSDKRFVIPVYQRNYDWNRENCRQLLVDLVDVAKQNRPSHFFGSIVASTEGDDYIIIDGQQRLTTVSLLLLALMVLITKKEIPCRSAKLSDKIREDYLIDKWQPDERKIKLKPVKNDMSAFNGLFGPEKDFLRDSNITQNYLFFFEMLPTTNLDADDVFEAIKKLIIIDITLEAGDDPQLIFESLNSTGLDLSEADKIRNFVLMGLDQSLQETMYDRYWNKIEQKTDYKVSEFIRQFLTFKQGKWPNIKGVYNTFKQYASLQETDIEPMLADILSSARLFEQIAEASTGVPSIDRILRRLNLLDMTVVNPVLFALLERMNNQLLSETEVISALRVVESYLFRRLVCEVPTNALNKVFASLNGEVTRQITEPVEYVPAMIVVLENKSGSSRFPTDAEFDEKVRARDFYNMRTKNKIYMFDRLENGDSFECLDVPGMMLAKENGLSVEHVMPQTLTEGWKKDLGEGYQSIHETWKNRIANLTLTAYNSKYSNRRFCEKLSMENGFASSPLPLNQWIGKQQKWGLEELESRSSELAKRFMELWVYPDSDFVPKQESGMEYALDDDFDFTGTKVTSYTFMGNKNVVKSWKEAAEGVLRQACELDPSGLRSLASLEVFPGNYLSLGRKEDNGWFDIGQDVFALLSTPTTAKIRLIESVFDRIGIDVEELSFEIRPDYGDAHDDEEQTE